MQKGGRKVGAKISAGDKWAESFIGELNNLNPDDPLKP